MGKYKSKLGRAQGRRSFRGSDVGSKTSVQGAELMVKQGGKLAEARKKAKAKKKARVKKRAKKRPRGM